MGAARADSCRSQREAAGATVQALAKAANVSDWTIRQLEAGGTAQHHELERIAAALSITTTTLGKKDL